MVPPKTNNTMNRKDYQKPAMRVVTLRHTGMLMTSLTGINSNTGLGYGGGGNGSARSRGFDDWDDWDEE